MTTKKRPAPVETPARTPAEKRLLSFTQVIFSKSPVTKLPKFDEEFRATRHGDARHRNRAAVGIDWRSVVDAIVDSGNAEVLAAPIIAKRVRSALAMLAQTHEVKLAATSHYLAFIKWVRRNK